WLYSVRAVSGVSRTPCLYAATIAATSSWVIGLLSARHRTRSNPLSRRRRLPGSPPRESRFRGLQSPAATTRTSDSLAGNAGLWPVARASQRDTRLRLRLTAACLPQRRLEAGPPRQDSLRRHGRTR